MLFREGEPLGVPSVTTINQVVAAERAQVCPGTVGLDMKKRLNPPRKLTADTKCKRIFFGKIVPAGNLT